MKNFYKNKTVWITGASSGIGEAMAVMLSKFGTKLILTSENKEELVRVSKICSDKGANVETLLLDQSDADMVETVSKKIISQFAPIDVAIFNAGISQRATVSDTSLAVHDKIMQVNFRAYVQITNKLLPVMLKNGGGYIGVTSSISGKFGFHLRSSYAASKHALHGFFESMGIEYRNDQLFVTIVCPGRVKTSISVNALQGDGSSYGRMDDGQQGGISAERCAKKYLMAIYKKRREKLIGGRELLMAYFKRFCPCLFYYIAKKIKPV